jgi:hypothetical protein
MMKQLRIIAGSGRSGTTWVQDVIAETNGLRPIFEPLHPQVIRAAAPYSGHYIMPDANEQGLADLFDSIAIGDLKSIWTDYRIQPNNLLPRARMLHSLGAWSGFVTRWRGAIGQYRRYRPMRDFPDVIVKLIRGNLMLSWLRNHYDARIIYVVRHPGAVIESRLRIHDRSWDSEPLLAKFRDPNVLGHLYERYAQLLNRQLNPVEAQALIWCIENQLPLEEAEEGKYTLVFYEHLVKNSEREWARITESLALKINPFGHKIVDKPSQQATLHRHRNKNNIAKNWLDRLSQSQIDSLENVLVELGVEVYRARNIMPVVSAKASG